MFEGATSWKLRRLQRPAATAARCPVAFTHAGTGRQRRRLDRHLFLVNTPAGWRVDDIAYGGGFRFGNTGTLTDTLKTGLERGAVNSHFQSE